MADQANDTGPMDADVIIVGAGAAGAMAAHDLAQRGFNVLILEAGPRFTRQEILARQREIWEQDNSALYPNTDLAPRTSPSQEHKSHIDNHGDLLFRGDYLRGVGGTTWHWEAVTPRFAPADFEMKTRYGVGIDWPFGYAALEADYDRAEREMGVAGAGDYGAPRSVPYPQPAVAPSYADLELDRRLRPHGFDFEARPTARNSEFYDGRPACVGHHNCSHICPIGAQYAAIVHVRKAEALGARVMEETLVERVQSSADGTVTGVAYRRSNGESGVLRARAFMIAGNPMETVRLCLVSASEARPGGIANSSGMVGRRLMDHHNTSVRFNLPFDVFPGRGPITGYGSRQWRDGAFRSEYGAALINFHNVDLITEIASTALKAHPHDVAAAGMMMRELTARRIVLTSSVEQLPDPENRIWLDPKRRDSTAMPRIQVRYSISEYTRRGLEASRKTSMQIAELLGANAPAFDEDSLAVHAAGTMMMGTDPRQFVTDAQGRCHDHPNLFVGGASLFPTNSVANPTLTIAALALRTSRAIAGQLAP